MILVVELALISASLGDDVATLIDGGKNVAYRAARSTSFSPKDSLDSIISASSVGSSVFTIQNFEYSSLTQHGTT